MSVQISYREQAITPTAEFLIDDVPPGTAVAVTVTTGTATVEARIGPTGSWISPDGGSAFTGTKEFTRAGAAQALRVTTTGAATVSVALPR